MLKEDLVSQEETTASISQKGAVSAATLIDYEKFGSSMAGKEEIDKALARAGARVRHSHETLVAPRSVAFPLSTFAKDEASLLTKLLEEKDSLSLSKELIGNLGITPLVLHEIRTRGEMIAQERGEQCLYLGIGTAAVGARKIPLLLIPITLQEDLSTETWSIQANMRSPELHPQVVELLDQAHRVSLDEALNSPDLLAKLFSACKSSSVSLHTGEVSLGTFPLGGYHIARDLDPSGWNETAKSSPIVSALLLRGFYDRGSPLKKGQKVEDLFDAKTHFDVIGADGSQSKILAELLAGENLVVEGPPGTGKSLSIANIVANMVARGKRVLIVSEKQAALEVVQGWLSKIGLKDAVLPLYGEHATARSLQESLASAFTLGKPIDLPRDETIRRLERAQKHLNDHVKALTSEVRESGYSAYEVLSHVIAFRAHSAAGKPDAPASLLDLDCPEMREWKKTDYEKAVQALSTVEKYFSRMGSPITHPFYGVSLSREEIDSIPDLEGTLREVHGAVHRAREAYERLCHKVGLGGKGTVEEVTALLDILDLIAEYDTEDGEFFRSTEFDTPELSYERPTLQELVISGKQLLLLKNSLKGTVKPGAYRAPNLEKIIQIFDIEKRGGAEVSRFKKEIEYAHHLMEELCMPGKVPANLREKRQIVEHVLEAQRLSHHIDESKELSTKIFGPKWQPSSEYDDSFWKKFEFVAAFAIKVHDITKNHPDRKKLFEIIKDPETLYLSDNAGELEDAHAALQNYREQQKRLFAALRVKEDMQRILFANKSLQDQEHLLLQWKQGHPRLKELGDYNSLINVLTMPGMEKMIRQAERWPLAGTRLVDSVRQSWFSGLAEDFFAFSPFAEQFQNVYHEEHLQEFRAADRRYLQVNGAAAALAHWKSIPRLIMGGQHAWLRREIEKSVSGARKLEDLLHSAREAIQRTKPVFLMSPEGVSRYLPQVVGMFDFVIFDESSQVPPEKGLGAMLRGKQIAVFGDTKQLPADSNFDLHASQDAGAENERNLIDILHSAGAPARTLALHYRSLKEGLVDTVNSEIYHGTFITFPDSSRGEASHGMNVTLARGTEIQQVAAAVSAIESMLHAHPQDSIGVVAINETYAERIRLALRERALKSEALRAALERKPALFVKTIDNVQGDERDRIIISLAGSSPIQEQFGALSGREGEKRFNVMSTRARKEVCIVSPYSAEEIEVRDDTPLGVILLKKYLAFAAHGRSARPEEASQGAPDIFQETVKRELEAEGLKVEANVGLSRFKVDLAVVDPDDPDRFILGICTDGKRYQENESARERDLIIPEALRDRGWNIQNLWIIDWFRQPEEEKRRILQRVEELRGSRLLSSQRKPDEAIQIKRESKAAHYQQEAVKPYEKATLKVPQDIHEREVSEGDLCALIEGVVEVEGPIHTDEVLRRISGALKQPPQGALKASYSEALQSLERMKQVRLEGGFIYDGGDIPVTPRFRGKADIALRSLSRIAPEELEAAVITVVKHACAIDESEITREAVGLLGVILPQGGRSAEIEGAISRLISHKVIRKTSEGIELTTAALLE